MGTAWHFVPDRVWITDGERRVIDQRSDPRASFAGHTRETPWDQLHRLYFTSYAVWNYLNTPSLFTLPDLKLGRSNPTKKTAKAGDVCGSNPRQTFLLTTGSEPAANKHSSLMKRGFCSGSIYVAVGPAAHCCFDHATFGGVVFPTLRRVVSRPPSGPRVNAPTSVLLQITDVVVND